MKSQKKAVSLISSICMFISIFLPWLTIKSSGSLSFGGFGSESGSLDGSISGIQGDFVIYGFLILILSGLGIFLTYRPIKPVKAASFIVGTVSSLLSLLLLFHLIGIASRFGAEMNFHTSMLSSKVDFESKNSNGFGLYILLISSVVYAFINFDKKMFSNDNVNTNKHATAVHTSYVQMKSSSVSESPVTSDYYTEVKVKPQEVYAENINREPAKSEFVNNNNYNEIPKEKSNRNLIIGFSIIIIILVLVFGLYIVKSKDKARDFASAATSQGSPEINQTSNPNEARPQSSVNSSEQVVNNSPASPSNNNEKYFARGSGKFPETSERLLTSNDLQGMQSGYWNKIMRNEIFARHGYIFKSPDMQEYFNKQSWYKPLYDDVSNDLSSIEKQNIATIKSME